MAVENGFNALAHQQFDHHVECGRPNRHGPAGVNRRCKCDGQACRHERADVGHKSQQCGKNAPENWVGHTDQIKACSDDESECRIQPKLCQEIAAQSFGGVIHRHGRPMQIRGAEQSDHTIAQILLLQQHKNGDDHNDPECGEW